MPILKCYFALFSHPGQVALSALYNGHRYAATYVDHIHGGPQPVSGPSSRWYGMYPIAAGLVADLVLEAWSQFQCKSLESLYFK